MRKKYTTTKKQGSLGFSHSKLNEQDKLYGTTTLGSRGQLVIPAQARSDLNLQPGDQLVVMGKFGKALGLIKADQIAELVEMFMANIAGTELEGDFKKHVSKVFGNWYKNK